MYELKYVQIYETHPKIRSFYSLKIFFFFVRITRKLKCSTPLPPEINDEQLMKSRVLNIDMQISQHVIQRLLWRRGKKCIRSPSAHQKRHLTEAHIAGGDSYGKQFERKYIVCILFF